MSSEVQVSKSITEAVVEFTSYCRTDGLESSTLRKYKNTLNHLQEFCVKENIDSIGDLKVVHLDAFRASRKLAKITSSKELELLRQFCGFCRDRDWCKNNVARRIKSPRGIEPNEIVPFELAEVKAIIEASCKIGRSPYERLRANAMVLTLRYTALRISDVATLRRDRISKIGGRWQIFLRTTKNKKPIFMPIPNKMKAALDRVPLPRSGKGGCPYYFWSGLSKRRTAVGVTEECLAAVFRMSGVTKAHAHRFRHTLATELLGQGATFEEVADILGNSPNIVRKHYAKWSEARQSRITNLLERVPLDADWTISETNEPK